MTQAYSVCHIPPTDGLDDTVSSGQRPPGGRAPGQQPGASNIPNIPPAMPNLASLTATVNAMRQVLMLISGQTPVKGRDGQSAAPLQWSQGFTTKADWPDKNNRKSRWTEESRDVEKVRIYNKDDKEQYVDVERINRLVMSDTATGESWTWVRDR